MDPGDSLKEIERDLSVLSISPGVTKLFRVTKKIKKQKWTKIKQQAALFKTFKATLKQSTLPELRAWTNVLKKMISSQGSTSTEADSVTEAESKSRAPSPY